MEERCHPRILGKRLVNLDNIFGYLVLPDNQTAEYLTDELKISGPSGVYGKSLLLENKETGRTICASLSVTDKTKEKIAVARFNTPVFGNVYFRWFSTRDNHSDMVISTDLYHVQNKEKYEKSLEVTEHFWKIYVTDILESDSDKPENRNNCNFLQLVFDPANAGQGKAIGDIDSRLGKVKISTNYNRNKYKTLFRDTELNLLPSDLNGPQRRLYLVIFERKHPDTFLACAKIRYEHPVNAK